MGRVSLKSDLKRGFVRLLVFNFIFMKITKLGHCCLLIETKGKRLLTDPGCFTIEAHSKLENIDVILFTHDHADHYHLDSLKILFKKNAHVQIFANNSVGSSLDTEGIPYQVILDTQTFDFHGILITGHGVLHAEIYHALPPCENIGFMIDKKLFYPGDAFTDPGVEIDVLALPVAGPWMKTSEAIEYALKLKPRIAFPVHDAVKFLASHAIPNRILPENGIEFIPMVEGESREF